MIPWIKWPVSMGVRLGRVLPDGPASVLQPLVTPQPVLTQHMLNCYPNCVMSNNSFHSPRSIGDVKSLIGKPEGGRLKMSEPNVCSCRNKRWVSSGAKGGNRVAGQVKDGLGTGCLCSQQAGLVQKSEGTHKSDEPVSKIIWNSWGGVPMVMLPM